MARLAIAQRSEKPVQGLGGHDPQSVVAQFHMPPDVEGRVEQHDHAKKIEFKDVKGTDQVIGVFQPKRGRNGQEPSGLQQARRGQAQKKARQGNKEQAPDDRDVQPPVDVSGPGGKLWPRSAGQPPPQVVGGPQKAEGHKEKGNVRMYEEGSSAAKAEGHIWCHEDEPDDQRHHRPMHPLQRGAPLGQPVVDRLKYRGFGCHGISHENAAQKVSRGVSEDCIKPPAEAAEEW